MYGVDLEKFLYMDKVVYSVINSKNKIVISLMFINKEMDILWYIVL